MAIGLNYWLGFYPSFYRRLTVLQIYLMGQRHSIPLKGFLSSASFDRKKGLHAMQSHFLMAFFNCYFS